jgi:hypothetical protein
MQGLMEETNKLLSQMLVMLNAYNMATMTDEQKKIYTQIIKNSSAFPTDIED